MSAPLKRGPRKFHETGAVTNLPPDTERWWKIFQQFFNKSAEICLLFPENLREIFAGNFWLSARTNRQRKITDHIPGGKVFHTGYRIAASVANPLDRPVIIQSDIG